MALPMSHWGGGVRAGLFAFFMTPPPMEGACTCRAQAACVLELLLCIFFFLLPCVCASVHLCRGDERAGWRNMFESRPKLDV